jgi:hypothetical protein
MEVKALVAMLREAADELVRMEAQGTVQGLSGSGKGKAKGKTKGKRTLSPEARAKIAAAQRLRWDKIRKEGKEKSKR